MLRRGAAVALAWIGAYALSVAVDRLVRDYPTLAAVGFWSVVGVLAWLGAIALGAPRRWLAAPPFALGLLALLGAAVGSSSSVGVALVLFGQAWLVWRAYEPVIVKLRGVSV